VSDSELDGGESEEEELLDLPALGDAEAEDEGPIDDGAPLPEVVDDGGDPLDDSYAEDVPIEVDITTDTVEPSAVGDDANGLDGAATEHEGVHIDEADASMLDEGRGHAEEGLEFGGDEELGLDPIPTEVDDGGLEGIDEAGGQVAEADELPPLDGAEEDDDEEELDLGIELVPPLATPSQDGDEEGGDKQ
jgi:hypothetical protein